MTPLSYEWMYLLLDEIAMLTGCFAMAAFNSADVG